MDGKLKGHAALWVANIIWGLNAPIGKSVLWSETHPQGVSPFALSVYRMLGACLLFWTVSLFLPREKVAPRDIVLLLFASVFGIQLNQMLFLWGLSLTSPIDTSIIATIVPVLTMVLATLFLREPITWLKAGGVLLGCGGALLLILVYPLAKKKLKPKPERLNADRLAGQTAIVTEPIDAQLDTGAVKVSGVLWTAKCPSCARIETGAHVKILRVEGAKLLVEPVEVPVNIR